MPYLHVACRGGRPSAHPPPSCPPPGRAGRGGLARWLVLAGLLDYAEPDESGLTAARELRAALYEHVRTPTEDRPTDAGAVAVINRAATVRLPM
ncbi:MAG: ABATE domain-containing protein [Pseudonocardia sp.]|nr:ABATE domain-containing protein [Pseudonocardia sp.]